MGVWLEERGASEILTEADIDALFEKFQDRELDELTALPTMERRPEPAEGDGWEDRTRKVAEWISDSLAG